MKKDSYKTIFVAMSTGEDDEEKPSLPFHKVLSDKVADLRQHAKTICDIWFHI